MNFVTFFIWIESFSAPLLVSVTVAAGTVFVVTTFGVVGRFAGVLRVWASAPKANIVVETTKTDRILNIFIR